MEDDAGVKYSISENKGVIIACECMPNDIIKFEHLSSDFCISFALDCGYVRLKLHWVTTPSHAVAPKAGATSVGQPP